MSVIHNLIGKNALSQPQGGVGYAEQRTKIRDRFVCTSGCFHCDPAGRIICNHLSTTLKAGSALQIVS
jgi:hypothetical protein